MTSFARLTDYGCAALDMCDIACSPRLQWCPAALLPMTKPDPHTEILAVLERTEMFAAALLTPINRVPIQETDRARLFGFGMHPPTTGSRVVM